MLLVATIDARNVPRETAAAMYLGEPERSIEEVVSSLCVRRVERPDFFFPRTPSLFARGDARGADPLRRPTLPASSCLASP